MKVKCALISVSDKKGLVEFAKGLKKLGIEIIASEGTFNALADAGVGSVRLSVYAKAPEMLGGRVKTLHPKIHAGILADRENRGHMSELKKYKIKPIDLVVVNLYPFRAVLEKNRPEKELVENIDIGGVALLRAAAKNFSSVAVVCDPNDYVEVIGELQGKKGLLSEATRKKLAAKVFCETAAYDSVIARYFAPLSGMPEKLSLAFEKVQGCRYGENPHQNAAVYRSAFPEKNSLLDLRQLNGKELSFNNFLDLNAAVAIAREFKAPCAAIVKHGNPCGVAVAESIEGAFSRALECDEKSAFGSIIALNRECDAGTAKRISAFFNEAVVAPSFEGEALRLLKKKENLRVLGLQFTNPAGGVDFRRIEGGLLLQESDNILAAEEGREVVSKRRPSEGENADLEFAWRIAKHVKSNAIVLAKGGAAIGIGAGQMNRVNSVKIALENAGQRSEGSALASDAFFPFRDNIDVAADKGVKAFIAPGGSIRDSEVIKAADQRDVSLVFTKARHFRH
ncbi:MAG: bifunctional phosphoribosylaminoimidazolecarboxamide formyltransferase/IMP cyclohydrolase [Candidatus Diapherotrites archaeon]